jgi:hypothetical protein
VILSFDVVAEIPLPSLRVACATNVLLDRVIEGWGMPEPRLGEPSGLDAAMLAKIDWKLALSRIIHDLRSDFIYAPHLAYIYHRAGDELITTLTSNL